MLFGDLDDVVMTTVTTGNDRILSGISGVQTLIGDVVTVTDGTLQAGHDLLDSRRLAGGRSVLTGDVDIATVSTSLTSVDAGADRLYGSLTLGDTIVGDVRELTGVLLEAGNDRIHGGGGNDRIYGDVAAAHGTDIGVSSGSFGVLNLEGGADTLAGEDGNDLIYGDVGNFDDFTGSLRARLQGNCDAISGGRGDDTIFGDAGSIVGIGNGGNDVIRGDAGND
ncbi:MAG TPA: calcium-binding protein, partial [Beijerinckiaceae bacterium]|nr:calcium-binding protein [Beijerinckiaceae bacterium]